MRHRLRTGTYGWSFVVFLSLTGCSPSAATKPAAQSPSQASVADQGERREVNKQDKDASAPTSLEALRRGEAAVGGPLKEVYFDFDRYELRADTREVLRVNADWLRANPSARVEIEGHADERGTSEYNLALGAKRTEAAKDYLMTLGVAAGRLSTISYGEEVPVCREKTEECWQRNRRARFVVVSPKPAS